MTKTMMKSKLMLPIGIIVALLVVGVMTTIYFTVPSNYIALDVNPSIELKTNRLNKVVSLNLVNDDAKQLMSGYKIAGQDLEDVIEDIVDRMILTGYITAEKDNQFLISVDDKNASTHLLKNVRGKIESYLNKNKLKVEFIQQSINISNNVLENAHNNNVSAGKMAIIEKLIQYDNTLTVEELAKTSIIDIVKYAKLNNINDLVNNYLNEIEEAYEAQVDDATTDDATVDATDDATVDATTGATVEATIDTEEDKDTVDVLDDDSSEDKNKVDSKDLDDEKKVDAQKSDKKEQVEVKDINEDQQCDDKKLEVEDKDDELKSEVEDKDDDEKSEVEDKDDDKKLEVEDKDDNKKIQVEYKSVDKNLNYEDKDKEDQYNNQDFDEEDQDDKQENQDNNDKQDKNSNEDQKGDSDKSGNNDED